MLWPQSNRGRVAWLTACGLGEHAPVACVRRNGRETLKSLRVVFLLVQSQHNAVHNKDRTTLETSTFVASTTDLQSTGFDEKSGPGTSETAPRQAWRAGAIRVVLGQP